MAEMGAIASVFGIAGAAIKSAKGLCDMVDTIKRAPEEITATSKDTHAFQDVVSSVDSALRDQAVQRVVTGDQKLSEVVEKLEEPLQNCISVLAQLKPRIQAHLEPTSDGSTKISSVDMKLYFHITDCRSRLDATKSTLDTALISVVL